MAWSESKRRDHPGERKPATTKTLHDHKNTTTSHNFTITALIVTIVAIGIHALEVGSLTIFFSVLPELQVFLVKEAQDAKEHLQELAKDPSTFLNTIDHTEPVTKALTFLTGKQSWSILSEESFFL